MTEKPFNYGETSGNGSIENATIRNIEGKSDSAE
jgi:hypothetical protein